jgi:hypothetical protein
MYKIIGGLSIGGWNFGVFNAYTSALTIVPQSPWRCQPLLQGQDNYTSSSWIPNRVGNDRCGMYLLINILIILKFLY